VEVGIHDLRGFTHDRHRTVDDRPFGGGEGMVLKPEPRPRRWPRWGLQRRVRAIPPMTLRRVMDGAPKAVANRDGVGSCDPTHAPNHPTDKNPSAGAPAARMDGAPHVDRWRRRDARHSPIRSGKTLYATCGARDRRP